MKLPVGSFFLSNYLLNNYVFLIIKNHPKVVLFFTINQTSNLAMNASSVKISITPPLSCNAFASSNLLPAPSP